MNRDELKKAIQQLLDGTISETSRSALLAQLKSSAPAREIYLDYVELHSLLEQKAQAHQLSTQIVPIDRILKRQRQRTIKIALLSTAAVFVIGLVVMQMFFINHPPPPATLAQSPGTEYTLSHSGAAKGSNEAVMHPGSRLLLAQGCIELTFASGIKGIITGPADLTLRDKGTLYINRGAAWFHVPEAGRGFTVRSSDFEVIDLGTEFAVTVHPDDLDEVHVFKGKVQVTTNRLRKESATLGAGEARQTDPVGRLKTIPVSTDTYLTKLPRTPLHMHWSFDKIEDGAFPATGAHPAISRGNARPSRTAASFMQTNGRFGKAIQFRASSGDALLTRWQGIAGNKQRSIACWVKLSPQSLQPDGTPIVAWGQNQPELIGVKTKWKLVIDYHGRPAAVGYDGAIAATKNIADGRWHHIACVHRSNTEGQPEVTFYVDGKPSSNQWIPGNPHRKTPAAPDTQTDSYRGKPVIIGASLAKKVEQFQLDELYIFEHALTQDTVTQLSEENQYTPPIEKNEN